MGFTVKQARQYAGFTQREMAEKLGISRDRYRKIEQSPEDATVATAKRISEVVGIPIDQFFSPAYLLKVDFVVHQKEVKKMESIQKEIQERREHSERLKQIALKLLEQLKSENVSFSDAERIISLLSASVKTERDDRTLSSDQSVFKPKFRSSDAGDGERLWHEITAINHLMRLKEDEFATSIKEKFLISILLSGAALAVSIFILLTR